MKIINASWPVVAIIVFIYATTRQQNGSISGSIRPADEALHAWAISGKDTFNGSIVQNKFIIDKLSSGRYKLVIEAQKPYKNAIKENVRVVKDLDTPVGEMVLQKK